MFNSMIKPGNGIDKIVLINKLTVVRTNYESQENKSYQVKYNKSIKNKDKEINYHFEI